MKPFLVIGLLGVATSASAAPKVKISSHTKTVEIRDDAWGLVAFRMEIPDDWKFEGVLLRDPACGTLPTIAYRLTSPDGLAGVQAMPQFGWHTSNNSTMLASFQKFHCKIMDQMTPAAFLAYIVPAIRPEPTIGKIEPTFDAAQIDAAMAEYNKHVPNHEVGGGVHSIIEYTFHGEAMEENIRVVVHSFESTFGKNHTWASTADVLATRAPKGQLKTVGAALGPLMDKSNLTNEWVARMGKKLADDANAATEMIRRNGEATRAMMKRNHETYMASSKRNFDHAQAAEREREDAMHRGAVAWTLYAGDQQMVANPKTGEVSRVTNRAGTNVHQDSVSGDMIIAEDPTYDPSYYIRGQWTQLEVINP